MDRISVLLVDDHPVVRQGLVSLLSQYPDIHVIAQADRAAAALEQATALRPDVILLDIRLDDASGLDIARQLKRMQSPARIIILTSYDDEHYMLEAARVGVDGYLLKNASAEGLADAIRAVRAGEKRLSPTLGGLAFRQLRTLSQSQVRSECGLSNEELQLLELIANGVSLEEMTRSLYWSDRTVKRKTKDVLAKLGATSRAQAVAKAFRLGLL
ncbi:MAG: response regulator transcription factor [Chloroflexi bacterium]|nr:response regulator transcription factor [Chloroflexota bacterium]